MIDSFVGTLGFLYKPSVPLFEPSLSGCDLPKLFHNIRGHCNYRSSSGSSTLKSIFRIFRPIDFKSEADSD